MHSKVRPILRSAQTMRLALLVLSASLCLVLPSQAQLSEVPPDDFRISTMGVDGDASVDATHPAIVYNSTDDIYVVCWETDDHGEEEIWCEALTEAGGGLFGGGTQLSYFGPTGTDAALYDARSPAISWNSTFNTYLLCWEGDTNEGSRVDEEFEIFCRRLDENLSFVGGYFALSNMGSDGDPGADAFDPTIAYNFQDDNWVVCWSGDQDIHLAQSDEEFEIFCRAIDSDGTLGTQQRISFAGGLDDPLQDAYSPVVVYGSTIFTTSESVVCWRQDNNGVDHVDEEFEIYCRRLDDNAAGVGDFVRMTEQGGTGDPNFDTFAPTLAFDPFRDRYVACWHGDQDAPLIGNVDNAFEIFCGEWDRNLNETIAPRAISFIGPFGDPNWDATYPSLTFAGDGWGLCYSADEELGAHEIHCRQLDLDLAVTSRPTAVVSSMGSNSGDSLYDALRPALARSSGTDRWLAAWYGDDDDALFEGEFEIWGQLLEALDAEIFTDGFESGDLTAWSASVGD